MAYLFRKEIIDWTSWAAVLQSIEDFRPLISAIFEKERLEGIDRISLLAAGTNAVFRVGEYVIKILAPCESGVNQDADYDVELQSMRRAYELGIRTPRIVAASSWQDKYLFAYIVMDFIDGELAGHAFNKYDDAQKMQFIQELKHTMSLFNTIPDKEMDTRMIRTRALMNSRWEPFPECVKRQVETIIGELDLSDCVYVHGDLNANNLIQDENHRLYLIDFAECIVAPVWYEYPPILFDLFDHDRQAIKAFMADSHPRDFQDKVFGALLLHDFGADFIRDIYIRHTGKMVQEMKNIDEIRSILSGLLN
ncbi:phosphotransferase [Bacillus sp. 3255]|uniref:phosphotransferase n=1 Tax=Bacillus sp. 3255 TaxID=2817904 RepID=UPI00285E950A|nr:phosphotransferase [Bacillus sp. 3255]MDR6884120.1 tRNA A-37 threonylcarbamoyl transferase component Bud32 [Bacillus sp. 3255]